MDLDLVRLGGLEPNLRRAHDEGAERVRWGLRSITPPPPAAQSMKEMNVGERGFEPPAPASRRQCSTRLSYSPTGPRTDGPVQGERPPSGGWMRKHAQADGHRSVAEDFQPILEADELFARASPAGSPRPSAASIFRQSSKLVGLTPRFRAAIA